MAWRSSEAQKIDAEATLLKSTIPHKRAAIYPAMIAIRIGITAKNLRNNTDPRTAVKSVTRNTITFFGSMEDAVRPALEAAVPAKFKSDQCDNRSHSGRGKYNVDPFGTEFADDQSKDTS